jgi:hypothetical protein
MFFFFIKSAIYIKNDYFNYTIDMAVRRHSFVMDESNIENNQLDILTNKPKQVCCLI